MSFFKINKDILTYGNWKELLQRKFEDIIIKNEEMCKIALSYKLADY